MLSAHKSQSRNSTLPWMALFGTLYLAMFVVDYWPIKSTFEWAPGRNNIFGDLGMVLRMMECSKQVGLEIYTFHYSNGCSGYTYGYLFAQLLSRLGIGAKHSELVGYSFILILILSSIVISWIASQTLKVSKLFVFFVIFSPPFWLAVAAPNFDALVFLFLLIALYFELQKQYSISLFLISISALVKFFTLPLLILLFCRFLTMTKVTLSRKALFFCSTILVFISTVHDIEQVDWNNPNYRMANGIFHVFGIDSSSNWIKVIGIKFFNNRLELGSIECRLIGVITLFSFLTTIVMFFKLNMFNRFRRKRFQTLEVNVDNEWISVFLFFAIPFLTLFFQGQNYDSKLIFLTPPLLLLSSPTLLKGGLAFLLKLSGISSIWFSCFWPHYLPETSFVIVELIGDTALLIFTSILIIILTNLAFVSLQKVTRKKFRLGTFLSSIAKIRYLPKI